MTKLERLMKLNHIESMDKPKSVEIIHISREDFDLMDATKDNTIYYIAENNGTVTMIKGDNK